MRYAETRFFFKTTVMITRSQILFDCLLSLSINSLQAQPTSRYNLPSWVVYHGHVCAYDQRFLCPVYRTEVVWYKNPDEQPCKHDKQIVDRLHELYHDTTLVFHAQRRGIFASVKSIRKRAISLIFMEYKYFKYFSQR